MATIKHAIEEHDVVALRVPNGTWPAGTSGTVVSLCDGAALVEVAEDDPPGSALDNLLTVPFEELELRWSHRTGWVHGMEA
ncbi:MAG: hypothetical protein JO095_03540 [Alphaproteobacteria bacterium]|nr:hypothetical protein [Alphaproteobacteria bacterium]MBV9049532.1 hypothetical protein [Solirubrobacterales bacterium]